MTNLDSILKSRDITLPKCFILFIAMVNGIFSLISLSIFSLLMYRNTRDFCVLILYRVFSNELVLCIRWPKYWSFSISPSSKYSELIPFWIDWFDLLAFQGILKSSPHHSSKSSLLQYSAFFMVHLSHPNMTTGKNTAFTIRTFVGKVMSLLFNTLTRFVIAFLPRKAIF